MISANEESERENFNLVLNKFFLFLDNIRKEVLN